MPIVYAAFFKEPAPDPHHHSNPHKKIHEAPVLMVVPLVFTATGALVLFFWPTFFLNIARIAMQSVTGGN
jgi:multicomponent Na+:H+ antiporter subunit D